MSLIKQYEKHLQKVFRKYAAVQMLTFEDVPKDEILNEVTKVIEKHCYDREFGQFFTPCHVSKIMADLVKPKENELIFDPSSGLNSLLFECYKYTQNPDLIYGQEIDGDIYETGLKILNEMTGHKFKNITQENTLKYPPEKQFDIIVANSPYGLKRIKYEELDHKIFPIKTTNSILLFLCLCVHLLKDGGRCAFLMPIGQEITNKAHAKVRNYFLSNCNVKKTIRIPANTFTNTKIETVILYFEKGEPTNSELSDLIN